MPVPGQFAAAGDCRRSLLNKKTAGTDPAAQSPFEGEENLPSNYS